MPVVPFRIPGFPSESGFPSGVTVVNSDRRVGVTTLFQYFARQLVEAGQDFMVVANPSQGYPSRSTTSKVDGLYQRMRGRRLRALIFDAPSDGHVDSKDIEAFPLDGVAVIIGSVSYDGNPLRVYDYRFVGEERVLHLRSGQDYAIRQSANGLQAYGFSASNGVVIQNRFEIMMDLDA